MAFINNPKEKGAHGKLHKDATMRDPLEEEQKSNAKRILEKEITPELVALQKANARKTLEKAKKQGGGS